MHTCMSQKQATGLKERNIAFSITRKEEEEKKGKKKSIFPHGRGINKPITVLCFLD